jgi:hypothetical protein
VTKEVSATDSKSTTSSNLSLPDNAPYKISPTLFRTAAKADRRSDWSELTLPIFFSIDPTSMPCNDTDVLNWARSARLRAKDYKYEKQQARLANRDSGRFQSSDDSMDKRNKEMRKKLHRNIAKRRD